MQARARFMQAYSVATLGSVGARPCMQIGMVIETLPELSRAVAGLNCAVTVSAAAAVALTHAYDDSGRGRRP